jgi:hypothetical protein
MLFCCPGTGSYTCVLILVACHFQFTASRPNQDACEPVDIKEFPEYIDRCKDNTQLCKAINCTLMDSEKVCYSAPTINPDQFCVSVRDLKIPEDCLTSCCQDLKAFLPDGFITSTSSCIELCTYKEQTSQLCQYLKLAIQSKYMADQIQTNLAPNTEIKDATNSSAVAISVASENQFNKETNESAKAIVLPLNEDKVRENKTQHVIEVVTSSTSTTVVADLAENNIGDVSATGEDNEVNKDYSTDDAENNEIPDETINNDKTGEGLEDNLAVEKGDDSNDNIKTGEGVEDNLAEEKVDETNNKADVVQDTEAKDDYKESESDVVNIDAVANDNGLPFSGKVEDTMNTGPYADDDSSFMAYFLLLSMVCIIAYLVFHNKQKILALILEGRRSQGSRRRSGGRVYNKLDSTVEDSMNLNRETSLKQVIY